MRSGTRVGEEIEKARRMVDKRVRHGAAVGVLLGAMACAAGVSGCRVSESDVRRWETTERGPHKLVAVITHDKYAWNLRVEAADAEEAVAQDQQRPAIADHRHGARDGAGFGADVIPAHEPLSALFLVPHGRP